MGWCDRLCPENEAERFHCPPMPSAQLPETPCQNWPCQNRKIRGVSVQCQAGLELGVQLFFVLELCYCSRHGINLIGPVKGQALIPIHGCRIVSRVWSFIFQVYTTDIMRYSARWNTLKKLHFCLEPWRDAHLRAIVRKPDTFMSVGTKLNRK